MSFSKVSKVKGVLRIILVGYAFGLAGAGPLAIKLHYDDKHWTGPPPRFVTPEWFYSAFAFGLPAVISSMMVVMFLRDTNHRRNDPFRFSRRQYRFAEIDADRMRDISETLRKLGYVILTETVTGLTLEIEGRRGHVINTNRFREKKHPTSHKLRITGKLAQGYWRLQLACEPLSSLAVADFRNTIFDSLEEVVDVLEWRSSLRNSAWMPIDAYWRVV